MREYYIRREGDEDSSGPYDIDQISSLIEANKLDAEAYFYDIESETWAKISSNQEMMDELFPKKKKLTLRTGASEPAPVTAKTAKTEGEKPKAQTSDSDESDGSGENSDEAKPEDEKAATETKPTPKAEPPREKLDVKKMLAQADGRADDASGKSPREKRAAAAFFGLRSLTVYFIASILAMAFLDKDLILSANAIQMAKSPYVLMAAFDLVMTVFLLLQVTEVYPLLRFRAALGAGLLTILFYSSGDTVLLLSNLLIMGAIYFSTALLKFRFLLICSAAGALGILGYVYRFFLM